MKNQYILPVMLLLAGFLAACGGNDNQNTGSASSLNVTIPAVAPRTILTGCSALDLEDWFEKNYFNVQTFVDEAELRSRTAEDERRSQMDFVLDRLVSLRNAVNNAPAPSCIEATHKSIVDEMQVVIDDFQQFANAVINADDLETRVRDHLQGLKQHLDTLTGEVNPLMQIEPAPTSPAQ